MNQELAQIFEFLSTAPADWRPDQKFKTFMLPTQESITCVLHNGIFHISGTDIVRILAYRFKIIGREISNNKKFEEGVFSDLRNVKAPINATLEEPRSMFLDLLYRGGIVRTQKKQKVFHWFSVPHDLLLVVCSPSFFDKEALERDRKKEMANLPATTHSIGIFTINESISLANSQCGLSQVKTTDLKQMKTELNHFDFWINGSVSTSNASQPNTSPQLQINIPNSNPKSQLISNNSQLRNVVHHSYKQKNSNLLTCPHRCPINFSSQESLTKHMNKRHRTSMNPYPIQTKFNPYFFAPLPTPPPYSYSESHPTNQTPFSFQTPPQIFKQGHSAVQDVNALNMGIDSESMNVFLDMGERSEYNYGEPISPVHETVMNDFNVDSFMFL